MVLSLNTIKPGDGATKKRKRVGRGNSSGHGTYSTKGMKGQRARAGVSNLKRLGMRQLMLRTPKSRGFKSLNEKAQVVNLADLNKFFKDGDEVSVKTLTEKGLIKSNKGPVKLLGNGELTVKNLKISEIKMSAKAAEKLK